MVWNALTSCFVSPFEDESNTAPRKNCVFCNIESLEKIISQDERFVVFHDRAPAAQAHLLVIPREHIVSVKSLGKEHASLVREMEAAGRQALIGLGFPPETHVFGFHVPPFNSINHLHLHAQATPYISKISEKKYRMSEGKGGKVKGWAWFVEVSQAIKILENGGKVKVRSC